MAYFLLLLNHIDICKFNSLIQYLEIVIELSSSNEIYRNRAGGLVWRPERNSKEFDHLFAFCNCSSSVAVIASPLVLFECSMTAESNCGIDLTVNGWLRKCDRTKRNRFLDLSISSSSMDRFSPTLAFWELDFLACMRSMRLFSISILSSSASRAFCVFLTSFSVCVATSSRVSFSRATVRLTTFLAFLSTASYVFSSRVIACYNFLSATVRYRWRSVSSSAAASSHARVIFAALKNRV